MSRFRSNTIQCKFCDTALSLRRADILAERRSCRRWRSRIQGRARMRFRHLTCLTALTMACLAPIGAQAFDEAKYPDLKGEWRRVAVPSGKYLGVQYDPHKPAGPGQQSPLTREDQACFGANLADQALGGQAGDPTFKCLSPGMPRVMGPYGEMEIVVLRETTYILIDHIRESRLIASDSRDFPANMTDA